MQPTCPPTTTTREIHEQLHPAPPPKVLFGKGQVAQLRDPRSGDARIPRHLRRWWRGAQRPAGPDPAAQAGRPDPV